MGEQKFSPGPWHITIGSTKRVRDVNGRAVADVVFRNKGHFVEKIALQNANAALLAASPSLYASESLNLELLKKILVGYEGMVQLILSDKDVQEAIKDEAVLKEHPEFNPVNINAVLEVLRTRIKETEDILAQARGEEVK